jgi:AbrB family looped-hinge helix DNA binding protein
MVKQLNKRSPSVRRSYGAAPIAIGLIDIQYNRAYLYFTRIVKRLRMPILSPKRQVTLPKELCQRLHVQPGDEVDILEHRGRITIVKKGRGRSAAILKHLRADRRFSDEDSLADAVQSKRRNGP